MRDSKYVLIFVLIMTTVVALVLALLNTAWKSKFEFNESVFNKRSILNSVEDHLGNDLKVKSLSDQEVQDMFSERMKQIAIDAEGDEVTEEYIASLYKGGKPENIDTKKEKKKPEADRIRPLYVYSSPTGKQFYITSIRGSGLWDEIWGWIALEDDLKTVVGAAFDHTGETPGLGAEIKDNPSFPSQFKGKSLYNADGEFTSVIVRKGGAKNPLNEVDGISGATITADGVGEMLYRGMKYYQPYFDKIKKS